MSEVRLSPIANFRYNVIIEGISSPIGFSEVTGFDISLETIEYREGNSPLTAYKIPGLQKYSNITLKRGVMEGDENELYNWIEGCLDGVVERKKVTIQALNGSGNVEASWEIYEAWPVKYTAPDFNSTGNEVAIESLELTHERLKRIM